MVSDEYIRMSREAKELRDLWEPEDGHRFLFEDKDTKESFIDFCPMFTTKQENPEDFEFTHNRAFYTEYTIWLPRQEDLIKIMENNWEHGRCELIGHFHNFSWNYIHDRCEKYDFNELWLMVLMEYVYDKRWDGKEWVKQ